VDIAKTSSLTSTILCAAKKHHRSTFYKDYGQPALR